MKSKNSKLFPALIASIMTCSASLVACSSSVSSSNGSGTTYCQLVKEVKAYNDLKVTASINEDSNYSVNATFTNNGDQYVPIYTFDTEYCDNSGVVVGHFYSDYKCPFEHRYIAPAESFTVKTDYYPYSSQEDCVNKINNKSVRTCYYTTEYTGMKFSDLKIRMITEEERRDKKLYNYAYLFYKPSGKFIDGNNYHLLVNFTFKGETYTVMSSDPEYEMHAFGFSLEHPYYINYNKWDDPEGYYKDYTIEDSMFTVNWVKCYTAWFRDKQDKRCRDTWRCYQDKTLRFFKKLIPGLCVSAIIVGIIVVFVIIVRKNKKADNN